MSTTLYRLQLVAASALALVPSASAQLSAPPCPAGINCDGTSTDDIKQIIVDILTTVLDFVLLLALVYVIVAGLRLIISGDGELVCESGCEFSGYAGAGRSVGIQH
jgi:hypothetical protein